jgi:mannose-1-phosphate guanylyltransferase
LKAFLLAAGHGTRLRPLTDKTPKCLLPIQGIPMLQIWMEVCARFGIDEVLINIHSHADAVRQFLARLKTPVRVHIVEEKELLGSAGTLLANREWLDQEPLFWVFYADVLHRVDLAAMLQLHQARSPAATLAVSRVPDPTRCGIVSLAEDGTIGEFIEKPRSPKSNLAFAGLLIGTQAMLDTIPSKHPVDIGFDVLPQLTGRMMAYPVSDYLIDIGTFENYTKAQQTWPGVHPHISQEQI